MEINNQNENPFKFGIKANTLIKLKKLIKNLKICDLIFFSSYIIDFFQKMIDEDIKIKVFKIRVGLFKIDKIRHIKVAEKSSRFEEIFNYEN